MTNSPAARADTHGAIWRWHFYAGLIVAPFLLILAVTGAIYLFNDELNDAIYPDQRLVPAHAASIPVSRMIAAAITAHPGVATRVDIPSSPTRSAVVFVTPRDRGPPLRVSIDPGDGRVLGALDYDRTLVGFADHMHGSLTLGTLGERLVELAACWALVLIATGLYLWWPRSWRGVAGVFIPRLWARGRLLWRDLHATAGAWTLLLIGFLLVTGLPWADVQGQVLKRAMSAGGVGYAADYRPSDHLKSLPMKTALGAAPWALEDTPMPASEMAHMDHSEHAAPGADDDAVGHVDAVVAAMAGRGMTGDYRLFLPRGPTGVFTAYTYPDHPQGQRTLNFDRYSHRLIREVGYRDYGWGAQAVELGVQLHMGNYFGTANQVVMLIPCLGIVALVISGVAMWWARRPAGQLAAPPRRPEAKTRGAVAILALAGLVMPLLGLSLIAVAILDCFAVAMLRHRATSTG